MTLYILFYAIIAYTAVLAIIRKIKKDANAEKNVAERNLYDNVHATLIDMGLPTSRFQIIRRERNRLEIAVKIYDGDQTHTKKFLIDYDDNGNIEKIRANKRNGGNSRESMPMEALIKFFEQKLAQDAAQLSRIEQQISEEGEAVIYAQSFNDDKELSRREMRALCEALEADNFLVLSADFVTGTIHLDIA